VTGPSQLPQSAPDPGSSPPSTTGAAGAVASAPAERGWGKLILAVAAFLLLPTIPQLRALLPVDDTIVLFVPALAACAVVGWWAGGRAFLAVAWVGLAVLMVVQTATPHAFVNLARGWSLLLAGAFGLVCLVDTRRPLFTRSLVALGATLLLAMVMSLVGPVTASQASTTVSDELARRNAETMSTLNTVIEAHPAEWQQLTAKIPQLATLPAETTKDLSFLAQWGTQLFPALLALESLAALALAWATYHRLSRARLGAPLEPLREFKFNDQLVWGFIVGLTIILLPTMTSVRGTGKNLIVFFGALYAMRGFGVLTWFMAPGSVGVTLAVGFLLLWVPLLNAVAALGFLAVGVASLALGLGDTWADWRGRARAAIR
jgi:hypothetical protein